ncbi:unnamed protein product [Amoebophrya sp. A120]|nr:unnamed protein product [Amoebophrya sp. A120]|eukprot:GSA120T00008599001.1
MDSARKMHRLRVPYFCVFRSSSSRISSHSSALFLVENRWTQPVKCIVCRELPSGLSCIGCMHLRPVFSMKSKDSDRKVPRLRRPSVTLVMRKSGSSSVAPIFKNKGKKLPFHPEKHLGAGP